uniref:Uncharacterized protein n=1 Tax=Aegilops tauschii subsp. strangulata TaxID=200361 RepID=A0A453C7X2_AEGTS
MDDPDFDKALYDFYVSHKANFLKRKITDAGARNVVFTFRCSIRIFCTQLPL